MIETYHSVAVVDRALFKGDGWLQMTQIYSTYFQRERQQTRGCDDSHRHSSHNKEKKKNLQVGRSCDQIVRICLVSCSGRSTIHPQRPLPVQQLFFFLCNVTELADTLSVSFFHVFLIVFHVFLYVFPFILGSAANV